MEKQKSKVHRLMLLSPDFYQKLQYNRSPIPSDLLEIEKKFLLILNANNLTTSQKLVNYKNLFTIALNAQNHSKTIDENLLKEISNKNPDSKAAMTSKIESIEAQTMAPPKQQQQQESIATQTRFIGKRESGNDPMELESFEPKQTSSPLKDDKLAGNNNQRKFEDIYEADKDNHDFTYEKDAFLENLRIASEKEGEIDLNDYSIRYLTDPTKEYAMVRDRKTQDIMTVEKPKQPNAATPKRTRSGRIRMSPRKNLTKNPYWTTYEEMKKALARKE